MHVDNSVIILRTDVTLMYLSYKILKVHEIAIVFLHARIIS